MSIVKTYVYRNKKGEVLGEVRRYEKTLDSQPHKSTVPHFKENSQKGIPEDFPAQNRIYGMETFVDESAPVFIVEGEKCAYALQGLGFQALTSLGGCGSVHLADWSILDGAKTVYILPDNDDAGEKYAQTVYRKLRKLSPMPNVQVLRMPEAKAKGDVVDWLVGHEALQGWNELDSLKDHPARDTLCKAFEHLYQTRAEYVQGEDRTRMVLHLTKARHIFGADAQDIEAELDTQTGKAVKSWGKENTPSETVKEPLTTVEQTASEPLKSTVPERLKDEVTEKGIQ